MASVGDLIWYNENPGVDDAVDSWTPAQVVATPTSNGGTAAGSAYAYYTDYGNGYPNDGYPTPPEDGQVLLTYWANLGWNSPTQQTAYATEGTGPGQYQTSDPTS